MIYGTICGGPLCAPGAGGHAVPRGRPPSQGPRWAPLVPGVGTGGTSVVPAGTVGAASSLHRVAGARAEIAGWVVKKSHFEGGI